MIIYLYTLLNRSSYNMPSSWMKSVNLPQQNLIFYFCRVLDLWAQKHMKNSKANKEVSETYSSKPISRHLLCLMWIVQITVQILKQLKQNKPKTSRRVTYIIQSPRQVNSFSIGGSKFGGALMVCSHYPTLTQTPRPRLIQLLQCPLGICVDVCLCAVWTPPHNSIQPIFIGLGVCVGVGQCEWTIRTRPPFAPNSFIFMQLSGKMAKTLGWHPNHWDWCPLLGTPISATAQIIDTLILVPNKGLQQLTFKKLKVWSPVKFFRPSRWDWP